MIIFCKKRILINNKLKLLFMKNKLKFTVIIAFLIIGMTIFNSACDKEDPEPTKAATSIELISGGSQTGEVNVALANPIEIIVKDQNGDAFAGTTVNFSVTEGSVSSATITTGANGKASITWTLGASVGIQSLAVTAFKSNGTTALTGSPLTVRATATPEPTEATSIELVSGGDQTGEVELALANPIEIIVKDENGDAFAGEAVNFSVTEGSVSDATITTGANGTASISWTLGASLGTQTLTVTAFKEDGTTALTGSPLTVNATATEATTVTDIDGNIYDIVIIGDQRWMSENLKTAHLNDGTAIPMVSDSATWEDLTSPGYCWFDNDSVQYASYGALYNWYTVNTDLLCPTGWHVPTDNEWFVLTDYLINNGYGYEGSGSDISKSMALTSDWHDWNIAGTPGNDQASNNSSGFSAHPIGYRANYSTFSSFTYYTYWWSTTEFISTHSYTRYLHYHNALVLRSYFNKANGFSVRCVKD